MSLDIEAIKRVIVSQVTDQSLKDTSFGFDDYGDLNFGVGLVAGLISEVERLQAQVDRVYELHSLPPIPGNGKEVKCYHRKADDPCPTVQALE